MHETDKPRPLRKLFGRLLRDEAANILMITGAAIVPMVLIAGSGIDISRLYLAKSRLQAACDSGVLAGRKAMDTIEYTSAAEARAEAMFAFNYEDGDYQSHDTEFEAEADDEGRLDGEARTTVPMLVMNFAGFEESELEVTCSADIQVPNIDIVFVLDVTGSMDETIGGTRKITSLRLATIDFYDAIATAMAGNTRTRVRYGFVPYSQAVNGSELFVSSPNFEDLGQLPMSHLAGTMTVQTRVANFDTPRLSNWQQDPDSSPVSFNQRYDTGNQTSKEPNETTMPTGTDISDYDCSRYGENKSFQIGSGTQQYFLPRTSWEGEDRGDSTIYLPEGSSTWQAAVPSSGSSYVRATFERVSWTGPNTMKKCIRRVTHTRFVRQQTFGFTNWTYRPLEVDVSNYKSGSPINYVSWSSGNASTLSMPEAGTYTIQQLASSGLSGTFSTNSATWNGCLEERNTTPATSFAPIPGTAYDLDYLTGGTSDNTRWKPMIQGLTYLRSNTAEQTTGNYNSQPGTACPGASMRNLREYDDRTQFVNYVNSLTPNGFTYLDVGMVWGLRLIAADGIFAERNLTGPNGGQISRHIIFLTDGAPVSELDTYSAYGTEQTERRISGSTGVAASTLHARRFQALCDAERGQVAIWAVAFGTSVTGNMSSCADSGRAMQANNTTQLRNAFARIANEVADLRLVQ